MGRWKALRRAGATVEGETPRRTVGEITKADLYAAGLSGGAGSADKRKELLHALSLPERMSANPMLEALNALMSRDEFLRRLSADSDE